MFTLSNQTTRLACGRVQPRRSAFGQITHALAVWRSRRALATLTDAQLKDIGLTRTEALKEAQRPIWDAPAHWRG